MAAPTPQSIPTPTRVAIVRLSQYKQLVLKAGLQYFGSRQWNNIMDQISVWGQEVENLRDVCSEKENIPFQTAVR